MSAAPGPHIEVFGPYLERWRLIADGEPFQTRAASLLPVRQDGVAAMLKISGEPDEKVGHVLLQWWDGEGAARVLEHDGDAMLLERACGHRSLAQYARDNRDGEATRILCGTLSALHAPRQKPLPLLLPLREWFRDLDAGAQRHGGVFGHCQAIAAELLAQQRETCPLHGDLHHENVLDFGDRGWLAIDPKRLYGDRAFDYAILFANPDLCHREPPVGVLAHNFHRRLEIVAEEAGMARRRLLGWIAAWSALSAVWFLDDGMDADIDLRVAHMALAALDGQAPCSPA